MTKQELINLFNEVTQSRSYTVEEKIKMTSEILKQISEIKE